MLMLTDVAFDQDHPLFVLERHLLKYQTVYPREPIARFHSDDVFARSAVHTLHTREVWLKVCLCCVR